eukprot:5359085-Prymnesium_polylepis.2
MAASRVPLEAQRCPEMMTGGHAYGTRDAMIVSATGRPGAFGAVPAPQAASGDPHSSGPARICRQ